MEKHVPAGENVMLRRHCANKTVRFVLGQAIYMGMKVRHILAGNLSLVFMMAESVTSDGHNRRKTGNPPHNGTV